MCRPWAERLRRLLRRLKEPVDVSAEPVHFRRIAIVGLGLIGGSWALALERARIHAERVGCDQRSVLRRALACGAIERGSTSLTHATQDADLIIVATPIGTILKQLRTLSQCASPGALITDVGSTKQSICERARQLFKNGALFLGGHPLAGRERSGFGSAGAELLRGATYLLSPVAASDLGDPRVQAFERLVRRIGARPHIADAAVHDRQVAYLSHLPQLVSTALASLMVDNTGPKALSLEWAASGFRDMTRLAESPYHVWRDICQTNSRNIEKALDELTRKLQMIRRHLKTPRLEAEFQQALKLRRELRKVVSS